MSGATPRLTMVVVHVSDAALPGLKAPRSGGRDGKGPGSAYQGLGLGTVVMQPAHPPSRVAQRKPAGMPPPQWPGPDLPFLFLSTDSFWLCNSLETDSDLPAGWMRVQDTSGTYYWHIPTGTTQWEPPQGSGSSDSAGNTPSRETQVRLLPDPQPWLSQRGFSGNTR